ncbi:MAG: hypothetical protein KC729_11075, partial [Candidatus Eisenbacteria bacterium]|nr:hypothetical protein [Candidatus Eisenbacteria bacterium]
SAFWMWPEAAAHAERAATLIREDGAPSRNRDPELATALRLFGLAAAFNEDPRAPAALREALDLFSSLEPDDAQTIASTRAVLAFALWRSADPHDPAGAEAEYRLALDAFAKDPATPNPGWAGAWYSFAAMAAEQGHLEEAERRYLQALSIYDRIPEGRTGFGRSCVEDYARTLALLGRPRDARGLLQETWSGQPPDIRMCQAALDVGRILRADYPEDASRCYRQATSLACRILAQNAPSGIALDRIEDEVSAGAWNERSLETLAREAVRDTLIANRLRLALQGVSETLPTEARPEEKVALTAAIALLDQPL